jgi:hypothetical protein
LNQTHNYHFFSSDYEKNVRLSFDLGAINYPDQYDLIFATFDYFLNDGRMCPMADITNRVYVPPPEFVISTLPSSVDLRPGEERNVLLQVKTNTNVKPQVYLSTNNTDEANDKLQLNFTAKKLAIPDYGNVSTSLNVKALDGSKPSSYTLPIFADIHIPTEAKPRRSVTTGELIQNSIGQTIFKNSVLTVTVKPPLTIFEYISNIFNTLDLPIRILVTLVTTIGTISGSALILFKKIKNRRDDKRKEMEQGW